MFFILLRSTLRINYQLLYPIFVTFIETEHLTNIPKLNNIHCPKKKFVNGNVFLYGRKCLSIHEEMFLWVLITSVEKKKLS